MMFVTNFYGTFKFKYKTGINLMRRFFRKYNSNSKWFTIVTVVSIHKFAPIVGP